MRIEPRGATTGQDSVAAHSTHKIAQNSKEAKLAQTSRKRVRNRPNLVQNLERNTRREISTTLALQSTPPPESNSARILPREEGPESPEMSGSRVISCLPRGERRVLKASEAGASKEERSAKTGVTKRKTPEGSRQGQKA